MALSKIRQPSFAAGEISPTFYGRADLDQYHHGLRRCRNFVPLPHGAIQRRPGFRYCGVAKAGSTTVRLVAFKFSNDDQVIIELGNLYARFWVDGAPVAQSSSPDFWSSGTTYALGDWVTHSSVKYISLQGANTNHDPDASPTWWSAQTVYEIATPYAAADLFRLKFAQSGDVIFITHQSYAPRRLTRYSASDWTLAACSFTPSSFSDTATWTSGDTSTTPQSQWEWVVTDLGASSVTAQKSNVGESLPCTKLTKTCKLGSDVANAIVGWTGFGEVAHLYNVYRGKNGIWGWVGQSNTNSFRDEGQAPDYTWGPPQGTNPFAGVGYYPAAVAFFDDRLCFGGSTNYPQTVYGSRVGDYFRFDKRFPAAEDASFEWMIASRTYQPVRSLVDIGSLLAFTTGGVWAIDGGQDPLSPLSVRVRRASARGASWRDPLVVGASILYEPDGGGAVMELGYSSEAGGYAPRDLSVLARHLFQGDEIADWCLTETPYQIAWVVMDSGKLYTLTYQRELGVVAWAQQGVHDYFQEPSAGYSWATPLSVCSVRENGQDIVYAAVAYGSASSRPVYLLRLAPWSTDEKGDSNLVDFSISAGTPMTDQVRAHATGAGIGATGYVKYPSGGGAFSAGDIGKVIQLDYQTASPARVQVDSIVSADEVNVTWLTIPPGSYTYFSEWGFEVSNTVSGLLPSTTMRARVNGAGVSTPVTSNGSGQVTLTGNVVTAQVGLSYTSQAELLDANPQALALKTKRVTRVGFEVETSGPVYVGENEDELSRWTPSANTYSGVADVLVKSGWNVGGRAWLEVRDPIPCTLLAVTREFDVGG